MGYLSKLFLFVFCLLTFAVPTHAQDKSFIFEKEMPYYDDIPLEEFNRLGVLHDHVPFRDKDLEFEVRLPPKWKESNSFGYALSNHVLVEAQRYNGPIKFNQERSHFTVQAIELDYQTSAKEWFVTDTLKKGYSIEGAKIHSENNIESLHVEVADGVSWAVRSITFLNGDKLVQASYYLPMDEWQKERAVQSRVIGSFKLRNIIEEAVIETRGYEFVDVAAFKYPSTWNLQAPDKKMLDFMQAQLFNYDEFRLGGRKIENGQINMKLYSQYIAPSMAEEMAVHLEELVGKGVVVQGFRENHDEKIRLSPKFEESRLELYDVFDSRYPDREVELWLIGMTAGDYYYVASLITPSRHSDFNTWTENTEAFKLVLSSLRPKDTDVF